MRVVYYPSENWDQFYAVQAKQSGHGIPGFQGIAYQRGAGLGNVLGRLFRFILPVAKKAAKAVGKQALIGAAGAAGDVLGGKNAKTSIKGRAKVAGANLANQLGKHLQKGKGRKGPVKRKQPAKKRRGKYQKDIFKDVEIDR